MAVKGDGFIFRYIWAEELLKLPEDLRSKINDAIQRFAVYGEEPKDEYLKYTMYSVIRSQIIRDREKYQEVCDKRRQAAEERWRKDQMDASDANAYNSNQMDASDAKDGKGNVNKGNVNISIEKDTKKKSASMRFIPPTLEEVREFVSTNGYTLVNAEAFHSHYASVGWKRGKTPLKDWKQAVINWQTTERQNKPQEAEQPAPKRKQLM